MKKSIMTLLLCAATLPMSAQTITLKECLERGLEKNYSILITRGKEQIAHNNATRANAGYLPTLDFSGGYDLAGSNSTGEIAGSGATEKKSSAPDHTARVSVDLNWTLFDGFKATTTYKQLKEMERMGERNTRIAVEDFIATLTGEYYNFIQQRIRLKNYFYAVQLSKERLRIVEERYHIGNFSRLDYQQAKVDFNADSARYVSQQEVVITSRIALNELMAEEQVYTPLYTSDTTINVNTSLDFTELWNNTLADNAELLQAASNNTLAKLDYKKVTSRNYPYLKLNAGYDYGYNKYEKNTYSHRSSHGWNGGLTVGINLWDGNRRRERRNAKIEIANSELQRKQLELALKADLGNLWQAYRNNIELLNLEKQNLITARENHEIAKERYMLGDLSGFEIREAQQSLLDAEERLLSAQYKTKICEISLLQISGKISRYLE